ncbi:MAG: glycerol-3-phosphate dehydrogenase [Motiliproteus sp.]
MPDKPQDNNTANVDLLIIGGGINGTGIAADAAARGLKVMLCEMNDLASATSCSSSKLIHGGLRYLEHYQFNLVRKALTEREILLRIAPHIIHPLRFRLPHQPHFRPAWMIRAGLFLYDHLSRNNNQPKSIPISFNQQDPLQPELRCGFEYSDAWVDDARLVILNAMAARNSTATIRTRCRCTKAIRQDQHWQVSIENTLNGTQETLQCKVLVNATGPWVSDFYHAALPMPSPKQMRLVKGSHIVVPRIHDQPQAYILQNADKRIVFVIPFQQQYSLIGTTDVDYQGDPSDAQISAEEQNYLISVCNQYFKHAINTSDIVWSFSGVRPLIDDDQHSPQATTRDFHLELQGNDNEAPLLSIFGGKLTTYRILAQQALDQLQQFFPAMASCQTQLTALPGGDFSDANVLLSGFQSRYPWLDRELLGRWLNSYGTLTDHFVGGCKEYEDLGQHFGSQLYQREVDYLIEQEWAISAEDILWRRSKLGLAFNADSLARLEQYLHRTAAS